MVSPQSQYLTETLNDSITRSNVSPTYDDRFARMHGVLLHAVMSTVYSNHIWIYQLYLLRIGVKIHRNNAKDALKKLTPKNASILQDFKAVHKKKNFWQKWKTGCMWARLNLFRHKTIQQTHVQACNIPSGTRKKVHTGAWRHTALASYDRQNATRNWALELYKFCVWQSCSIVQLSLMHQHVLDCRGHVGVAPWCHCLEGTHISSTVNHNKITHCKSFFHMKI